MSRDARRQDRCGDRRFQRHWRGHGPLTCKEGCNVVLAARREDRLRDLAAELGEGALAAPTDVTDPAACASLVARTVERFGSLEILVNNAGLGRYGSIVEGDPEDWRLMFDVKMSYPRYKTA